MAEILCSTGALIGIPNGRDYRLLKQFSKQLTCDGFEFMIYPSWYDEIDDVINFTRSLNLNIPVIHCEKKIGESISIGGDVNITSALSRFETNCIVAKELGANKMVLHLWDGVPSDKNFSSNMDVYPKLAALASSYNQTLLVENVVCNTKDPMSRCMQLLESYPEIDFVFDTKMAEFHKQCHLIYEPEYASYVKRIKHYHVNDYAGGFMDWENLKVLPVGHGNIDFNRFFDYIRDIEYDGTFTLEATAYEANGDVNLEIINAQIGRVREFLAK